MSPLLLQYIRAFSKLNRGHAAGTKEQAPHKPVMLLAVMDELEAGSITDNRIFITPELVARFKDNWSQYVRSEHFSPDFTKPFYHLNSEGFWHLTLYRAFDRFLISIDGNYRVRVAADVLEEGYYGLRQFEGKEILLPVERRYWPGRKNLEWYWGRFGN